MFGLTVASAIALLQQVPKALAMTTEFKALWERVKGSFSDEATQSDLQAAYDAAISDAGNAHNALQDIVRRHGG